MDEWKQKHINIGVIGESGCGKTTLINTIRNLYPDDKLAAQTDINECTLIPTPYCFPTNDKIVLWDLPGVNTPKFPFKSYLNDICFPSVEIKLDSKFRFNFYLIMYFLNLNQFYLKK